MCCYAKEPQIVKNEVKKRTFVLKSEKKMNYIEVEFICTPHSEVITEVLSATLGEIGFESFVDTESGIKGYVQQRLFDRDALDRLLADFPVEASFQYKISEVEDRNWNEEWEKNYFQPLVIDDRCIIQSTFHHVPATYDYNIYIDPKMAFGTGHHQTTELVIREILNADFAGKSLLDMGCGTAILAILASMRGADPVLAIDIDEWAYDNAKENLNLNKISNVDLKIGGAELLNEEGTFDVILANINRNILLTDICVYASVLNTGGSLYMSGFYKEDIPAIREECEKNRLKFIHFSEKDNWVAVKFDKI